MTILAALKSCYGAEAMQFLVTAGYSNVVVLEYGYRTSIMYGWTGREALFADVLIRLWDEIEA